MKGAGAQEKLFRKVQGGDAVALADLLEAEREGLYDYLLRMTGQVSRSSETVDEVYQSLTEQALETIESFAELKVLLYATARKFNADIWNAETSKLMNLSVEGPPAADESSPAKLRERATFAAIDKALRVLPGRSREPLILATRAGFEAGEAAEVLGVSPPDVESTLAQSMKQLVIGSGLPPGTAVAAQLETLPRHPLPPRSSQATVNLSVVMQGIKARPVGLWSPLRIALLVVVLGAAAFAWLNQDLVKRVISGEKAEKGERNEKGAPPVGTTRPPPP